MNLYQKSIDIILSGQAPTGAYVASPTFSQYGYSWLRDGTWIAYAMDCVGQHDSAHAFYHWVGQTLDAQRSRAEHLLAKLANREVPEEADYLPTRFTVDGDLGTDDWWDFQLDGYGTWLWGLAQHLRMTESNISEKLRPAITMTVRYLEALWPSPNYDCWEEHRQQIHPATLAAIYGGLSALHEIEPELASPELPEQIRAFTLSNGVTDDGHLMKYLGNPDVDASLLWTAVPYGLVAYDDPLFTRTLTHIEEEIRHPGGGVYRYAADTYYGGGEWLLLTAWLGWTYAKLDRLTEAEQILHWIEAQANPHGELPEQVSDHLLEKRYYPEWVKRWGEPACPLLWSHAMYLILKINLEG